MSVKRSDDYGLMQKIVDDLYRENKFSTRLDAIILAENYDAPADIQELVSMLPPGKLLRSQLCVSLNSSITGHGWGFFYGTVG